MATPQGGLREPPVDYAMRSLATWRSGYAAACKAVYTGSIPVVASTPPAGATAAQGEMWTRHGYARVPGLDVRAAKLAHRDGVLDADVALVGRPRGELAVASWAVLAERFRRAPEAYADLDASPPLLSSASRQRGVGCRPAYESMNVIR